VVKRAFLRGWLGEIPRMLTTRAPSEALSYASRKVPFVLLFVRVKYDFPFCPADCEHRSSPPSRTVTIFSLFLPPPPVSRHSFSPHFRFTEHFILIPGKLPPRTNLLLDFRAPMLSPLSISCSFRGADVDGFLPPYPFSSSSAR